MHILLKLEDIKKSLWILAYITISYIVLKTVCPLVYPVYQNYLFTIESNSLKPINIFCLILCVVFIIKQQNRYQRTRAISNLVMFYLNILYYIPGFLLWSLFKTDIKYNTYYIIFWLVINLFHLVLVTYFKGSKWHQDITEYDGKDIADDKYTTKYDLFAVAFILIILLVSLIFSNFKISILTLFTQNEVLQMRAEAAEQNIHWIFWNPIVAASMLFPAWFCIAKKRNKKQAMILLSITVCAMYSIGANRMFLFLFAFAIAITYFRDDDYIILKCLTVSLVIAYLEYNVLQTHTILDVYRRLCVTPNSESRFYVDFFSYNEPDYARQLLERWLILVGIDSPYDIKIPKLIGDIYFRGSNCNTGLLGYAFGNYGVFGLFFGPFLYIITFGIYNYIMKKFTDSKVLHCFAVCYACMVINDRGWFEYLLLPSFLLIYYIIIWLMPSFAKVNQDTKEDENV